MAAAITSRYPTIVAAYDELSHINTLYDASNTPDSQFTTTAHEMADDFEKVEGKLEMAQRSTEQLWEDSFYRKHLTRTELVEEIGEEVDVIEIEGGGQGPSTNSSER